MTDLDTAAKEISSHCVSNASGVFHHKMIVEGTPSNILLSGQNHTFGELINYLSPDTKVSKRHPIDIVCINPTSDWRRIDAHDVNMMSFWCQCLCSESLNNSYKSDIRVSKRHHVDIMCVDPTSIWRRIDAHDVNIMSFWHTSSLLFTGKFMWPSTMFTFWQSNTWWRIFLFAPYSMFMI